MKRLKKIYRNKDKQTVASSEQLGREKISEIIKESAKFQSFSPVYSKQYSYKTNITKMDTINLNNKENTMEEIYKVIEEKIKESGYKKEVSGFDIYNEISDLIDSKDNGTYILMSKPYDDVVFEYCVDVMSDNFNLSYINITVSEEQYHIDFDH